jgi:hypothetical protein
VNTSMTFEQRLLEKIRKLPSERAIEVEDFIDFLYQRETESDDSLVHVATKMSENSFSKIWNNSEDAQYDTL